jgi:hypothetical protein
MLGSNPVVLPVEPDLMSANYGKAICLRRNFFVLVSGEEWVKGAEAECPVPGVCDDGSHTERGGTSEES